MLNLSGWLDALAQIDKQPHPRRQPLPTAPCLARNLPSSNQLDRHAERRGNQARKQHLLDSSLASAVDTPLAADPPPAIPTSPPLGSSASDSKSFFGSLGMRRNSVGLNKKGRYEPFEVLRAIEKKDIMLLHEVKMSQFDLLVTGTPLPLVYAMRLGKSHHDVAIILVGAMSRQVNDTSDDELALMQPSTRATLRALRANLKIAITASLSLPHDMGDTSLLSSFLQVIVMLEGSRFLLSSTQTLSLALRTPRESKPVETAQKLMHKWVSRELKERQVASVEEYIANGVGDLVLLGLWSVVQDQVKEAEPIPLWFFARDDRIQKAIEERLSDLRRTSPAALSRLSRTVKAQLDTALEVLGQRSLNGRERVEKLRRALDEGKKVG